MTVRRYRRQFSARAELVAFGVLHYDESTGFISYHLDLSGSKTYQPGNLDRTSIRPVAQRNDVNMNAVLRGLRLRHPGELHVRPPQPAYLHVGAVSRGLVLVLVDVGDGRRCPTCTCARQDASARVDGDYDQNSWAA